MDSSTAPTYIPLTECVDRGVYEITSRNLLVGVFRAERGGFIGIREKFDSRFLFEEYHYDTGPPFGTVRPTALLGSLPAGILLAEYLPDPDELCECGRATYWQPDDPAKGRTPGKRLHRDDDSPLWDAQGAKEGHAYYLKPNTALFEYLEPITAEAEERWRAAYGR